ncbi:MAG: MerR family transcriptional regulator [Clostridia bacterium]|nr:MerR family transcriptional regulator [Clostridia bacterium]
MKIKEVIEKTGLTDRAIRLYIDEGLALPSIAESYSGRKSIDFSENDVERLKNVALLRKAGFSIAEIKSMVDDNSTAKNIVEKFIERTKDNIAHETVIVEKLKGISFDEEVTIGTICNSLSETVEEKEVPKEDMKSLFWKKVEKNPCKAAGITGLIITGVVYILTFLLWSSEHKHIALAEDWYIWMLVCFSGWLILDALCVLLILFNRDKSEKRNEKSRRIVSAILTVLSWGVGVIAFYISLLSPILSPFYSLTTDIRDYLVLDSWVEDSYGEEIRAFFPEEIPECALESSDEMYASIPFTTRYYYKQTYDFDQFADIVAEWKLDAQEYEKAKTKAAKNMKYTEKKGDWILVYYQEDSDYYPDKYIFAYNDKQMKVRYIAEITFGTCPGEPYFLSLDW